MAPDQKGNNSTPTNTRATNRATTPTTIPTITPADTPTNTRASRATTHTTTPATTPTTAPATNPTTTPTTVPDTNSTTSPITNPADTPRNTRATTPTSTPATTPTRVTRSSTRRGNASLQQSVDNPEPRKRKKTIRTVIIEYSKQPKTFKTKAIKVKNGLEKELSKVNVVLNPEKPRNGCFEIREEGGEVFVSLLDMEQPFTPLKELDVEKVISDIIEKIQ